MQSILDEIYTRLQEAELEAEATTLRFSSSEVLDAMWEAMRREQ